MAWVFGGKKFGQYTYEHWYDDDEYEDLKKRAANEEADFELFQEPENTNNTTPGKPQRQP